MYTVYRLPLSMYIQNNTAYYSGATLCIAYYTVLFIIRYCICIVYCSTLRGGVPRGGGKLFVTFSSAGEQRRSDLCRLIHEFTLATMAIACQPWLGFVYSEDNLSDGPSRRDLKLVLSLGAQFRLLSLPRLVAWLDTSFL